MPNRIEEPWLGGMQVARPARTATGERVVDASVLLSSGERIHAAVFEQLDGRHFETAHRTSVSRCSWPGARPWRACMSYREAFMSVLVSSVQSGGPSQSLVVGQPTWRWTLISPSSARGCSHGFAACSPSRFTTRWFTGTSKGPTFSSRMTGYGCSTSMTAAATGSSGTSRALCGFSGTPPFRKENDSWAGA